MSNYGWRPFGKGEDIGGCKFSWNLVVPLGFAHFHIFESSYDTPTR